MKKIIIFITVFVFSISVYSAKPQKAQTSSTVWQGEQIPTMEEMLSKLSKTGGFVEMPCFIPDLDVDFFACTGIYQGRKNQNKEEVKAFALADALYRCENKILIGFITVTDKGVFINRDEAWNNFNALTEVAQVSCVKYSVEKGIVTAYVGIKVPKKELSKKVKELEKIGMYPEKNPTNVKNEKKVPDDEAISEEEKQMIEMIEKRLKEAEETDKTEEKRNEK